ncbi:MAG: ribosome biogenesis GTPase Der, partial [Gammaproteobacteria bacterium]|nr:ribosome biogenesis GTPase Der [Gammaproteobacteria bacterium]
MLPIVVIVGRPNVGKSTLFNRLTGTQNAIVADIPGVTRDRLYGYGRLGSRPYVVVDTGGLGAHTTGIESQMRLQTERAIAESDALIFVVDARDGLTPQDELIARELRRAGKRVVLAVNKAENIESEVVAAEFHALALGAPVPISAAHGSGCRELIESVLAGLPPSDASLPADDDAIRIAVIGRPNVGKSTLVNRLLGADRVIASDQPGTTRDSIYVPWERDGQRFVLIDTAGLRRRARIDDTIERQSVARALQAIDAAQVVVIVLDAHDVVGEQDASVLGLALERGRALLIAVNKWDGIASEQRAEIRRQLDLKLDFVPFAPRFFISARHGTGVGELIEAAVRAHAAALRELPTPRLTQVLQQALQQHQPPLVRARRIKLRYAHQGGRCPPRIA